MTEHERTVPDVDCLRTLPVRLLEGCRELIRLASLDDHKLQSQQFPSLGQPLQRQLVHLCGGIAAAPDFWTAG
jgi:hypothetical protein